ncbi:MAG: hypothetical protein Q7V01_00595, partial [Vicinamibacterales bacterium]|nr:hypothetical protein [Vicinamibacterales bacterium]
MTQQRVDRRTFMTGLAGVAVASAAVPGAGEAGVGALRTDTSQAAGSTVQIARPRIRFAVIGINHGHIYSQVGAVLRGGGELVWLYAKEPDLVKLFQTRFPQVTLARSEDEVLQDASIQLVLSSAIPVERAPIGLRVMRHGKDYMADKPGITTLEQLAEVRRVQAETRRIY